MKNLELIKKGEELCRPIDESTAKSYTERDGKRLINCSVEDKEEMLRLDTLDVDFSEYDSFSFYVYSSKADNESFEVRLYNPIGKHTLPEKPRYFAYSITRDFVGLRHFEVKVKELHRPIPYASYCGIAYLSLHYTGTTEGRVENLEIGEFSAKRELLALSGEASPADFDLIKRRKKESLVGDGSEELLRHPDFKTRLLKIDEQCQLAWDEFRATYTGELDTLYGQKITIKWLEGEFNLLKIITKFVHLAKGYAAKGSKFYKNPELFSDLVKGLDFLNEHYYGKCVHNDGVWGNWWTWHIGLSGDLLNILVLLEEDLTKEQIDKYLYPVDYYIPFPSMEACNRMWLAERCILAAAFHQDGVRIVRARKMILEVFEYVTEGDGFYEDGSFIQHGWLPYAGGYGLGVIGVATNLSYMLSGTAFAFSEEITFNQFRWVKETYLDSIYKLGLFSSLCGRQVSRSGGEKSTARTAISTFITMSTYAPSDTRELLLSIIKEALNSPERNAYFSSVSAELVLYLDQIDKDDSIKPLKIKDRVKSFARTDRVARHSENYGACVALTSQRILKYESINQENKTGWYHSDASLFVYDGKYDYNNEFYFYFNPYRMPGVTANASPRAAECFQYGIKNGNNFAGGVEGEFGLAAQDLEYTPGGKYFECNLKARKSYFFFEKEIVALGSAISDGSGEDVYTTHENRKWKTGEEVRVNGAVVSLGEEDVDLNADYIHFDGFGGYVFPGGEELRLAKKSENYDFYPLGREAEQRENKISGVSFLEMRKMHGKNPVGEGYSCIYLPGATLEETKAYSESPRVKILEVTGSVHSVAKDGKLAICFFDKGESESGITASEPILLTLSESQGKWRLAVCDPTQALKEITLTLDTERLRALLGKTPELMGECERFTLKKDGGVLEIKVNLKDNLGRTYELK